MRNTLLYIEQKRADFSRLPFFEFLRDESHPAPKRLAFAPALAPFAMAFSDLNNFSLRIAQPSDLIDEIINKHSEEDATHYALYLQDLQTLGLDAKLHLSEALSFLWAPERRHARHLCYALTRMLCALSVELRLVVIEAIEATGVVAFDVFSQVAAEYHAQTGKELQYFGHHHRKLETGHTMGTDDIEQRLQAIELSAEESARAEKLVDHVFDLFTGMMQELHAFSGATSGGPSSASTRGTSARRSPASFVFDLLAASEAAGVKPDRARISAAIAPFSDAFVTKPVEIRSTTLPAGEREVSFRFVDERARGEVWRTARDWFQLSGSPADFMDAVHAAFSVRAEGIDADVRTGFRKAWAFLTAGHHIARFANLAGAPPALRDVSRVLERFGVQHMSIVGTDHHNQTCNLYPILKPGWAQPDTVRALASALQLPPMDDAWLTLIDRSVAANLTFSWTSGAPLRLAFYWPAPSLDGVPNDPVLRRFAAACPVVAAERGYVSSVAYNRRGHYRKVEVDYDGEIIGVLIRCAGIQPEE